MSSCNCQYEFMFKVDEEKNEIVVIINGRKHVMPLIKGEQK
jgi:hypothetical protein